MPYYTSIKISNHPVKESERLNVLQISITSISFTKDKILLIPHLKFFLALHSFTCVQKLNSTGTLNFYVSINRALHPTVTAGGSTYLIADLSLSFMNMSFST